MSLFLSLSLTLCLSARACMHVSVCGCVRMSAAASACVGACYRFLGCTFLRLVLPSRALILTSARLADLSIYIIMKSGHIALLDIYMCVCVCVCVCARVPCVGTLCVQRPAAVEVLCPGLCAFVCQPNPLTIVQDIYGCFQVRDRVVNRRVAVPSNQPRLAGQT
jgi:hypothetical protein